MEEKTLFRSFFDECRCLPAYLRWEALTSLGCAHCLQVDVEYRIHIENFCIYYR